MISRPPHHLLARCAERADLFAYPLVEIPLKNHVTAHHPFNTLARIGTEADNIAETNHLPNVVLLDVVRNRFKRLCREAFRVSRHEWPTGFDLVVIPRTNQTPTLDDLKSSLGIMVARLAGKLTREGGPR